MAAMLGLIGKMREREDEDVFLALVGVHLKAHVADFVARVELAQCYRNTGEVAVEVTSRFLLLS